MCGANRKDLIQRYVCLENWVLVQSLVYVHIGVKIVMCPIFMIELYSGGISQKEILGRVQNSKKWGDGVFMYVHKPYRWP